MRYCLSPCSPRGAYSLIVYMFNGIHIWNQPTVLRVPPRIRLVPCALSRRCSNRRIEMHCMGYNSFNVKMHFFYFFFFSFYDFILLLYLVFYFFKGSDLKLPFDAKLSRFGLMLNNTLLDQPLSRPCNKTWKWIK